MHPSLNSATLSQLAFPEGREPEFPMGEIPLGQYGCKSKVKVRFPPNIFFLTLHLNDVILNYVFFVEIPLIQFGCLLVCPLFCFFLLSVVVCLSSLTRRRLNVESACLFLSPFVVHS